MCMKANRMSQVAVLVQNGGKSTECIQSTEVRVSFSHGALIMYGKSPKISHTKVSDKMANANRADHIGLLLMSSLIKVYTVFNSTKYFKK